MGLGELGVCARLIDGNGDYFGLAHLPRPVEPGDLAALEQGFPVRVVAVIELENNARVDQTITVSTTSWRNFIVSI